MNFDTPSRRLFLKTAGTAAAGALLPAAGIGRTPMGPSGETVPASGPTDYKLTIATQPIEIAPNRIISLTTYNGQFPGPLLRFNEGQRVTVDVRNETDIPEQLHWHGQTIPSDVDGAAEEGTPFISPRGSTRISFVPAPSGFRFYHTHVRAGADLGAGQCGGLVGPVYIETRNRASACSFMCSTEALEKYVALRCLAIASRL